MFTGGDGGGGGTRYQQMFKRKVGYLELLFTLVVVHRGETEVRGQDKEDQEESKRVK